MITIYSRKTGKKGFCDFAQLKELTEGENAPYSVKPVSIEVPVVDTDNSQKEVAKPVKPSSKK